VERLDIKNSKVESIFCLNEVNEQKMNLGLYDIVLQDLPVMMRLFVGPKNSLDLKNLARIKVARCEKLEIVFSTSILRCLPQLVNLRIEECEELKHIIEDDLENRKSSNILSTNTCFPMLETLAVVKCNKLKCVFPVSVCNELPELKVLFIGEADELEEIFKSEAEGEGIQKVEIPNLKIVAFVNLPSLCYAQGIQFQAVKSRFIQNCQKLYLTSTSTTLYVSAVYGFDFNIGTQYYFNIFKTITCSMKIITYHAVMFTKQKQTNIFMLISCDVYVTFYLNVYTFSSCLINADIWIFQVYDFNWL
jgi:hypothetical protein